MIDIKILQKGCENLLQELLDGDERVRSHHLNEFTGYDGFCLASLKTYSVQLSITP